jgi:hypothetical protein
MEEAAHLDPEYLPQVAGIRNHYDRRDRAGKVSLPKVINRLLSPLLAAHGFEIRSSVSPERTWRQGHHFARRREGREQRLMVGSEKFGNVSGCSSHASFRPVTLNTESIVTSAASTRSYAISTRMSSSVRSLG